MDRSLDEIIAADTGNKSRPSGGRRSQGRRRGDRDGVRKPYTKERVDLNLDWVHDKFEDARDDRLPRGARGAGRSTSPGRGGPTLTKVRVENLHYDITESDLEDLFTRIGPVSELSLVYDRAGRSEGVAFVTYSHLKDAHESVREFDGANAKGQPIRLSLVRAPRERQPAGTLFDRVERPISPASDTESADGRRRRRRGGGGGGRARRSDVSKPPPDHIDRYVPGQRSPTRRSGGRRAGGRDGRARAENGGRRTVGGRPRKTQEELDQEMEDYWGGNTAGPGITEPQPQESAQPVEASAPAAAAPAPADDDIDMIE